MARRTVVGLFCIGVLLLTHADTFRAQTHETPVRSWSCLTSSAAHGLFGINSANPVCAGPVSTWQSLSGRLRTADTIAPPAAPNGLVATVSGSTVLLSWAAS